MHEVLVNRLGGLSLPRKSVVRLTDRPDMTLDVYRGQKTTKQQQQQFQPNGMDQISILFTFAVSLLIYLHVVVWLEAHDSMQKRTGPGCSKHR